MVQTPRELVQRCLTFQTPARVPRQMGMLPWALNHYRAEIEAVQRRFPNDIVGAPCPYRPSPRAKGDPYRLGTAVDEWGCRFHNVQEGVHGEVKEPVVADSADLAACRPPYEILPADVDAARDTVNRFCASQNRFVLAACCPRPWERFQFLRGSAGALMDILAPEEGAGAMLRKIHEFYLRELEFWITTDVDAINFMDDWGAQDRLLIDPVLWRALFKPLYRDYVDLIHDAGKFAFMHSDGFITPIYEDLVEVGVDAMNSQLFCMDMADLARRVKGRITFRGEIDRQHVLTSPDPEVARAAVRQVARHLYDPRGGIIANFELGAGAVIANATAIFEEWDRIGGRV
ncbi:MAG: methyltransferase [bacterium]|nr:methyltransferase [bacterium]